MGDQVPVRPLLPLSRLRDLGQVVLHLDGDLVRKTLSSDLGYTHEDRLENARRIASLAHLVHSQVDHVPVSSIAPMKSHREVIKKVLLGDVFLVKMEASLEECKKRDLKGLYKNGSSGIELFESSEEDLSIPTVGVNEQESVNLILT
jgi:adenylylsulfate kinase-like enzyme